MNISKTVLAVLISSSVSGVAFAADQVSSELLPFRSNATVESTQAVMNKTLNTIHNRLNNIRAIEERDANAGYEGAWVNVFANSGSKDITDGTDGYDFTSAGFMLGSDGLVTNNLYAGMAFTYASQESEGQVYDTTIDTQSYQFTLYGLYHFEEWFLTGSANLGFSGYDTSRYIDESYNFTGEDYAEGYASGYNGSLRVQAGYDFTVQEIQIQPIIGAEYRYVQVDSYGETGAYSSNSDPDRTVWGSEAALQYDRFSSSQTRTGAGLNISKAFELETSTISLSATTMAWYNFNAGKQSIDYLFISDIPDSGEPIEKSSVDTANMSEMTYELSTRIDWTGDYFSFGAEFTHVIENNYNNSIAQLNVLYQF